MLAAMSSGKELVAELTARTTGELFSVTDAGIGRRASPTFTLGKEGRPECRDGKDQG
jgi:hypothetical protein